MLIEHDAKRPQVDPSARVAPNAVLCGDVRVGANCSIGFGAVLTAESGPIVLGTSCIVMENAVIRGLRRHDVEIGNNVLIGPRAYLTGCSIEENVFLATGATVFNGARIGARSEVRINGVVHIRSRLPSDSTVPIGWVAVGDPAKILPPDRHEAIWTIQETLDFPRTVFGVGRSAAGETIMPRVMERYARALARHRDDQVLES